MVELVLVERVETVGLNYCTISAVCRDKLFFTQHQLIFLTPFGVVILPFPALTVISRCVNARAFCQCESVKMLQLFAGGIMFTIYIE